MVKHNKLLGNHKTIFKYTVLFLHFHIPISISRNIIQLLFKMMTPAHLENLNCGKYESWIRIKI